jgi:hypothetical protein
MSEHQVPAKWDEILAKHATAAAALETPTTQNISVRGGYMTLNGVAVPNSDLDCVIIASTFENQYYDPAKPFDPDNLQNPICFSMSLTGEEMVPDPKSLYPQSTDCTNCPQMAWKSDPIRKKGKACKEKRKLALLPAGQLKTGGIKKAELALLAIPVTSVKNWSNYVNSLRDEHQRPPFAMLTTISSRPHPRYQLEVTFALKGFVEEQFLGEVMDRIGPAQTLMMTPYEGQPEDPTKSREENAKKPKKY